MTPTSQTAPRGFALLMSLMVVAAVTTITVTIIELSLKQTALSMSARESEEAFHAAAAGVECVHYAWRVASTSFETGVASQVVNCMNASRTFGELASTGLTSGDLVSGSLSHLGRYQSAGDGFTWSGRCTQVDMLIINVPDTAPENTTVNGSALRDLYPGYSGNNRVCRPGARCVVGLATGYNRACSSLTGNDIVRREILLEF